ncbi:MAG: GGDEF domain-containing protein, partial [Fusobacterium sp.]|nr:GGDEF domain-containing protein [Fusobacterium sp.]
KRKIQYERDHDPLTKLMNHKYFSEIVKNIIKNKPLTTAAMLMIDLDNFKNINDTYGHDYGDTYLKESAQFLSKLCEKKGVVARRSGDEFCIFIYKVPSKTEIKKMLEDFYLFLQENKISFPNETIGIISMSIGLSWYDKNSTFENMLSEADEALY